MSEIYNANGTLPAVTKPFDPTVGPGVAITSSTNATPIVVTATAHGFSTGDTVQIEGHHTNTNANGLWVVTVTGANTFSLNGSIGNGVGGATGYAVDYSINPLITIPDDGDLAVASSINPAFEGIFNNVPFLYARTGKYRLQNSWYGAQAAGSPQSTFGSSVNLPGSPGSWVDFTGLTTLVASVNPGMAPIIQNGDLLDVVFSAGLSMNFPSSGSVAPPVCLGIAKNINGGGNAIMTETAIPLVNTVTNGPATEIDHVVLRARVVASGVATGGSTYDFGIQIFAIATTSPHVTLTLLSGYTYLINQYRPN